MSSIAPTAHYTGHVWARNGLSHPALQTRQGHLLYLAVEPAMVASRAVRGDTLEEFLVARHREIDRRLAAAIDAGRISQVIEVAAGLSPRGWRFARRYGDAIVYIETDLPDMALRKRAALEGTGSLGSHHRVEAMDALAKHGLASIAAPLDPLRGLAVITEGLLSYLDGDAVAALWRRVAHTIGGFSDGVYLSDLHLQDESGGLAGKLFVPLLSAFVRSRVRVHFSDEAEALRALSKAGFAQARLHQPSKLVRVVEASMIRSAAAGPGARRGSRRRAG